MEFVTLGDAHSGAFDSIFPELPRPDDLIYEAYGQAIDYARENGIKNVIMLGDIFDNPEPEQHQVNRFLQFLLSIDDFSVFIIPGNHDYSHLGKTSLETASFIVKVLKIPHVKLFMSPTFCKIEGVPFCFFPWPHYSKRKTGLPMTPSVNIAHVEKQGAMTDSGRVIDTGVVLNTTEDYWVIGHLHRHQSGDRWFYPGTMYQKTFGEPLPKGFGVFDARVKSDGSLKVKAKFVPIEPPFELHNIRVSEPEHLKLVLPQIEPRPILRYKLFIKKDTVAMPPDFLQKNPHVIKTQGWKTKEELAEIVQGNILVAEEPPMDLKEMVFHGLHSSLKQQGLSKSQRIKAKMIVHGILASLPAEVE